MNATVNCDFFNGPEPQLIFVVEKLSHLVKRISGFFKSREGSGQMPQQWKLKEFVQIGPESFDGGYGIPLQLSLVQGKNVEAKDQSLWFMTGFEGAAKNDAQMLNLFQRAVMRETFEAHIDLYLTPVTNPSAKSKFPFANWSGQNVIEGFTDELNLSIVEAKVLSRWFNQVRPRAIVTLSLGQAGIRHLNCPPELIRKLSEISELPSYAAGTEPVELDEDQNPLAKPHLEKCIGPWAVAQGASWIDFCIDRKVKVFDELKTAAWKSNLGPALKWLVEGTRFNPPKEEELPPLPKVIPPLEMPPEFANL
jgi:hypothetical protein